MDCPHFHVRQRLLMMAAALLAVLLCTPQAAHTANGNPGDVTDGLGTAAAFMLFMQYCPLVHIVLLYYDYSALCMRAHTHTPDSHVEYRSTSCLMGMTFSMMIILRTGLTCIHNCYIHQSATSIITTISLIAACVGSMTARIPYQTAVSVTRLFHAR